MSRVQEVLKNKNRVEKTQRARRKEELAKMQHLVAFKARLYSELKKIDILLDENEVDCIIITIPDQFLAFFGESIYSEDLSEYDIKQVENAPNKFYVRHKFVQF